MWMVIEKTPNIPLRLRKKNTVLTKIEENMITDNQTNKVYFSKRLTWYNCWKELSRILCEARIDYDLLENTKDKWARDYMPIQIEKDKFVSYVYNPDYLQPEQYKKSITKWSEITNLPPMYEPIETKLIIDGGNVIKCSDKVIITNKIFKENPNLSENQIREELERIFGKVIIIPWNYKDEWDFCGHADGMVRFIDKDYVLLNNFCDHPNEIWLRDEIEQVLKENHIGFTELHYNVKNHGVNDWAYLNFLQVGNIILMPTVTKDEDEQALLQLSDIYHDCTVIPVPLLSIVKANGKYGGGALNCISWNIYKD